MIMTVAMRIHVVDGYHKIILRPLHHKQGRMLVEGFGRAVAVLPPVLLEPRDRFHWGQFLSQDLNEQFPARLRPGGGELAGPLLHQIFGVGGKFGIVSPAHFVGKAAGGIAYQRRGVRHLITGMDDGVPRDGHQNLALGNVVGGKHAQDRVWVVRYLPTDFLLGVELGALPRLEPFNKFLHFR